MAGAKKRIKGPATPKAAARAAKTATKTAGRKTTAAKNSKARASTATTKKRGARRRKAAKKLGPVPPELFEPFTEGERADALRILTEDKRLNNMAKVGRYQVIAVEPVVLKSHERAGARLARLVIYDYASDRCIDAAVDLDACDVIHVGMSRAQPMLARAEEATAIAIAMADKRVNAELSLGDEPQVAMHYWSQNDTDLAYARRSAAVIFGRAGDRPSLVAVVDLLDNLVSEIIPAEQW